MSLAFPPPPPHTHTHHTQQGPCHFNKNTIGAVQTGIVKIPSGSEASLLAAVATAGPVSISVDGSSNAFRVKPASL